MQTSSSKPVFGNLILLLQLLAAGHLRSGLEQREPWSKRKRDQVHVRK